MSAAISVGVLLGVTAWYGAANPPTWNQNSAFASVPSNRSEVATNANSLFANRKRNEAVEPIPANRGEEITTIDNPFADQEQSDAAEPVAASPSDLTETPHRTFTHCSPGQHTNCVIDGDTFRLNGTKIRIADIDTPEIHPSRCAREEQLGQAAKQRLLELLNAGSFEVQASGRGYDRYGRELREVFRNGASLGEQLVREGLARRWDGQRRPWCE